MMRKMGITAWLVAGLLICTQALADPYKLTLKDGTATAPGVGGYTFNPNQADGDYDVPTPAMTAIIEGNKVAFAPITGQPLRASVVRTQSCLPGTIDKTTSPPKPIIELLDNGPSVGGLNGRLRGTNSTGDVYEIEFLFNRATDFSFPTSCNPSGPVVQPSFVRKYKVYKNGALLAAYDGDANTSVRYHTYNELSAAPIPEPGTLALLLAGAGGMGFLIRRRR